MLPSLDSARDALSVVEGRRPNCTEYGMEERFDKLEQMIGSLATRFDAVDRRFDAVDQRFNEVDENLKDMRQGLADVHQRVGVLHEDVKSDLRFTLEAQQALKEVMEAGFANQERSFREALAPIADAVRSGNRK